jgi:hypothetical protein
MAINVSRKNCPASFSHLDSERLVGGSVVSQLCHANYVWRPEHARTSWPAHGASLLLLTYYISFINLINEKIKF